MLENRKVYESRLEAQLAQWSAEIDVIAVKANRAEVATKLQYDRTIELLQRIHSDAGLRLSGLREATDDAWEGLKLGTEKTWSGFRRQFQHTVGRP